MNENKLPEYARKIAAKMFPQITKRSYSQWEVEKLLIAVCNEGNKALLQKVREIVGGMRAMTLTNPENNHPANAYKLVDKNDILSAITKLEKGE